MYVWAHAMRMCGRVVAARGLAARSLCLPRGTTAGARVSFQSNFPAEVVAAAFHGVIPCYRC